MPKTGETRWDAALARRLYDQGATFVAIGAHVGAAPSLVSQFAARHWPDRDNSLVNRPDDRKLDKRPHPEPPGRATLPPLPSLRAK
jgi:hypothetical protein